MKIQKKSQAQAANPAVLLAIITLIIVIYLVVVPPDYREKILGDSNDTDGDYSGYNEIFLEKSPGYWTFNSLSSMEHDLNSFNLMSRSDAVNLVEVKSIKSKVTAFSKNIGSFNFRINDIKKAQNFFINYKILSISGNIFLKVNGNIIKEIKSTTREDVVAIDKNMLYEGDNRVEFVPESIGFSFWTSNSLELSSASVYADIIDDSGLYNSQKFWLKSDEFKNIENVLLRYYIDCEISSSGRVDILINSNKVFSGIPDCKMLNSINNIDKTMFKENENLVEFRATAGRFIFDNVLLKSELKKSDYPTYYFTIEEYDYEVLQTGLVDVNITFTFPNDKEYKEVLAVLNGHGIGINTYDRVYTASVNPMDILEGNNVLEIRPKKSMHIVEVELRAIFD